MQSYNIIMYVLKNRFEEIRRKIKELIDENEALKDRVQNLQEDLLQKEKEIEELNSEKKKLSEEVRLLKLSSSVGRDTSELKEELRIILREIDESLELIRNR